MDEELSQWKEQEDNLNYMEKRDAMSSVENSSNTNNKEDRIQQKLRKHNVDAEEENCAEKKSSFQNDSNTNSREDRIQEKLKSCDVNTAGEDRIRNKLMKTNANDCDVDAGANNSMNNNVNRNVENRIQRKLSTIDVDSDGVDRVRQKLGMTNALPNTMEASTVDNDANVEPISREDDLSTAKTSFTPWLSQVPNTDVRALRHKASILLSSRENEADEQELFEGSTNTNRTNRRRTRGSTDISRGSSATVTSDSQRSNPDDGRPALDDSIIGHGGPKKMDSLRDLRNVKLRDVCAFKGIAIILIISAITCVPITLLSLGRRRDQHEGLIESFKKDLIANSLAQENKMNDPQSSQRKALDFVTELRVLESQLYLLAVLVFGVEGTSDKSLVLLENNAEWCEWSWVECGNNEFVSAVDLSVKGLDGTIVSEIKHLTELKHLKLGENDVRGTIPTEIGRLKHLETLILEKNELTGSIPESIWNLTNLVNLNLFSNIELKGTIHTSIGNMKNLTTLNVGTCALGGSIPSEVGLLSRVETIILATNRDLSGTIPTEIGQLKNLKMLYLYNSPKLKGRIPSLKQMKKLKEMNLFGTSVSGKIPTDVGNAVDLEIFNLRRTKLEGTIPTEFGELKNLQTFDVFKTNVNGTLPTEFGKMSALQRMDLSATSISGSIPVQLGNLTKLHTLLFCDTKLKGSLPDILCERVSKFDYRVDSEKIRCSCCDDCPTA